MHLELQVKVLTEKISFLQNGEGDNCEHDEISRFELLPFFTFVYAAMIYGGVIRLNQSLHTYVILKENSIMTLISDIYSSLFTCNMQHPQFSYVHIIIFIYTTTNKGKNC